MLEVRPSTGCLDEELLQVPDELGRLLVGALDL